MYIVRHAQPANQEPGYTGGPNYPLGKLGLEQAACVGEQFANWLPLDAMYSSTLQRALQTAEAIHKKRSVPWYVYPALSETDRRGWPLMRELVGAGSYELHAEEAVANKAAQSEHYPQLSKLGELFPGVQTGWDFDWPDIWQPALEAETREKTYDRARRVIATIRKIHEGTDVTIAIVCHAAFGSVILNDLLGCDPCDHNRFSFSHAAIARVDIEDDGAVSLRLLNYIGHLRQEMVTEGVEFQ
jgi:broad specificity phosphatase PhoE